ncbi:unnamed protein product, partial [Ceratitis capitata]
MKMQTINWQNGTFMPTPRKRLTQALLPAPLLYEYKLKRNAAGSRHSGNCRINIVN